MTWLFLPLLLIAVIAAWFVGSAVARRRGEGQRPHSRPAQHGAYALIWTLVPALVVLMAAAILLETALSFLGYGVQSPDTSLGKIISDNQSAFATRPWLFWWPGVFIIAIALCINFIGDGLRDAFDPRQKRMPSARALAKSSKLNGTSSTVK